MSLRLCSRSVQTREVGEMRKQQVTPRTFLSYPISIIHLHHSHISSKCLFLQWTRHGKYYIAVGKCSTMPEVPYLSIAICGLSNSRPIQNEKERRYLLFAVRNAVSVKLLDWYCQPNRTLGLNHIRHVLTLFPGKYCRPMYFLAAGHYHTLIYGSIYNKLSWANPSQYMFIIVT